MKNIGPKKTGKQQQRKSFLSIFMSVRFLFVLIALSFAATGIFIGIEAYNAVAKALPVREISFYGNKHLSDSDLRAIAGIKNDESAGGILSLQSEALSKNLLKSPWIKGVSIRKELPERLMIRVDETTPFAILEIKGRSFLVDDNGEMLEEIKGSSVPFLPVITADPFKDKGIFMEALNLAKVIKEKKIATERSRVEIIADKGPENLSMVIDSMVIKVGHGEYDAKLQRLFELEEEIKKRAIIVDYVDLRFANRVVVKPISEVVR